MDPAERGRGDAEQPRPVFLTTQARAVLFVWCGVTLVLVFIYAVVLVVL